MASLFDGLDSDFSSRVQQMVNESGGRITIVSGYRSTQRQTDLWNAAVAKYGEKGARQWVAPPGHSNHERGIAGDLGGDIALAHQLAPKYGLHFPMPWEPWHIEPLGAAHNPQAYTTPTGQGTDHLDSIGSMLGNLLSGPDLTGLSTNIDLSANTDMSLPPDTTTPQGGIGTAPTGMDGTDYNGGADIDKFMAAIAGKESGGNYNATNPDSGASGKFQIMPENWGVWSREAGLGPKAARSPANQELVAKYKMQQYYQQFGNWRDVAIAWYGGPGAVSYSDQQKNRKQGKYPSINQYADEVVSRIG